jgi:hypothetical protein
MALLARMRISLTNWAGGPGVTTWYFSEGSTGGGAWSQAVVDDLYNEVNSTYEGFAVALQEGVQAVAEPELAIIDSATGKLVDARTPSDPPDTIQAASQGGNQSRGVQMLIRFSTDDFVGGRRLKGRSYIGPLNDTAMGLNGQIATFLVAELPARFTALISGLGPRLAVYHRPSADGASDGSWGDVTSVKVRPLPSYLRSRLG